MGTQWRDRRVQLQELVGNSTERIGKGTDDDEALQQAIDAGRKALEEMEKLKGDEVIQADVDKLGSAIEDIKKVGVYCISKHIQLLRQILTGDL